MFPFLCSGGATVASASITSQTVGNTSINLTTLGGVDYQTHSDSTEVRKTGGGNKTTVTGYNFTTPGTMAWSAYTGGFQLTAITTTDATPSDVTSDTSCPFVSHILGSRIGLKCTVDVAIGTQEVRIPFGIVPRTGSSAVNVVITSAGSGELLNQDLTGITIGADNDVYLILSCTAIAAEEWTIDISTSGGTSGTGYYGYRAVWVGSV